MSALELDRWFDAPPDRVFRAFTDAADLRRWWTPRGFEIEELDFSAVEGASYRVRLCAPDGTHFTHEGVFVTVKPPASLVYTWRWVEGPLDPTDTLVELSFEAERGGTRVRLCHSRFVDAAERDRHVGWLEAFDRLGPFLVASG